MAALVSTAYSEGKRTTGETPVIQVERR